MTNIPPCPECDCAYTYEDGALIVCPECTHEWNPDMPAAGERIYPDMPAAGERIYKDVNGNVLEEGDYVTIIKDLKVKGTSKVAKVGTKVRINRLMDEDHDIDCKIDGIGAMKLKTQFVKKA